jgi:lambda repressor-like predicted transcriptional regulator
MTKTEIRAHILLKGKTLSQLAAEKGTTRQNLWSIVTGRTVSQRWQEVVAEFIGMPVDQVFPVTKEES